MKRKGNLAFPVLAALALPLALVACSTNASSPGGSAPSTQGQTSPAPAVTAVAASPGPQVIEVKTGDKEGGYFQDPATITVRPGTIRMTLVNQSAERPHNLVLKDKSGKEIAKTSADRVQPGQQDTFQFTIQDEGTYDLICTLPGHADRGARSTFVVQKAAQ